MRGGGLCLTHQHGRVRVRYGSVPGLCPWVIPRSICVQSRRHHRGVRDEILGVSAVLAGENKSLARHRKSSPLHRLAGGAPKRPSRLCVAPVNAPLSWPNSSEAISVGASAAQFTLTKARSALWDRLWTARAMSSLPVPVSPEMNTVESVGATLRILEQAVFSGMEEPTISLEHEASVDLLPQDQILPIELILERPDLRFALLQVTIQARVLQ